MKRLSGLIVIVALLAGCAAPIKPAALASWDWKYSEVLSAIDAFKQREPATGAKLPQQVRSIYIKGADALSVYLADSAKTQGAGCELTLKKSSPGGWAVISSRFFEY